MAIQHEVARKQTEGRLRRIAIAKVIALVLTVFLTACGSLDNNGVRSAIAQTSSAFKVAILLPGRIDDNSWSQAGYEGLKLIEKELGAQVAYRANIPRADEEKLFRQYASLGFDFIIGHGAQYVVSAQKVAEDFPRVKFAVTTSYGGNNKNLGALAFRSREVGYLAGVIAALKTKTNKVAYIGGESYPHTQEEAILFERGVKQTHASVTPSIAWVNSWLDVDKAKQIALAQMATGVDIIAFNADIGNSGILKAAKQKPGLHTISWMYSVEQLNQTQQLTSRTPLISVVQRVPMLLLEGATLAQQGRWEGKQYKFGLLEEVQDLALFEGFLTSQEEAYINSVKQDIRTGKINVYLE
jgi:basic membrane protein A